MSNAKDLESFIQQQIDDIKANIKKEEDLFKERNKAHFEKIEGMRRQKAPFEKILRDFEYAKKGVEPPKPGRKLPEQAG